MFHVEHMELVNFFHVFFVGRVCSTWNSFAAHG